LNVALINPIFNKTFTSLDAMVNQYFHPRELTKALSSKNVEATWVQGYKEEGNIQIGRTKLRIFKARPFEGGIEDLMSQHVDANSLARIIDNIKPDHVHILGLLPSDILQIVEICSKHTTRISASFHGGHPSKNPSFFELQERALKKLSAILFNAPERTKIWQEAGLIDTSIKIAICPETSSYFRLKERKHLRHCTKMEGDPVCVATSRLHHIKDPLTLLKGFEQILKMKPNARLYWVYQTEEMLPDINEKLQGSLKLRDAVQLCGSLEFEKMEDFYNSADFFIQASLQEYGGNSLVEAMACGVIPVVTNIPSFQYLTGNDRFGTLFEKGDSEGLAQIVLNLSADKYSEFTKCIREYFDEYLSFNTIAKTLLEVIR